MRNNLNTNTTAHMQAMLGPIMIGPLMINTQTWTGTTSYMSHI